MEHRWLLSVINPAGVLLYVLLYGRYPFYDNDMQKLFKKIREGDVHVPTHVSLDARILMYNLLRLLRAGLVAHALVLLRAADGGGARLPAAAGGLRGSAAAGSAAPIFLVLLPEPGGLLSERAGLPGRLDPRAGASRPGIPLTLTS